MFIWTWFRVLPCLHLWVLDWRFYNSVFLLIWIHTLGFLLWYPSCCFISHTMGPGCPYLLSIWPQQCSYRTLFPGTSGNMYVLFPWWSRGRLWETDSLCILYFFWPVTNRCTLPQSKKYCQVCPQNLMQFFLSKLDHSLVALFHFVF